uniref:non-specific serine/threonine protein kinase n=1 Tax=Anopheles minimus TaxID=112268 RepID=A0A182WCG3_9DIPT
MEIPGYTIRKQIGVGGCGEIFYAISDSTNEPVAIKVEPRILFVYSPLTNEKDIYKALEGGKGIPRIISFVRHDFYNAMVMELLGPSLLHWFEYCNNRFSLKTVLMLADEMLTQLEYIHQKKIIHRDIKPSNFVMGIAGRRNELYLIDYGLAINWSNPKRGMPGPAGTNTFMSINSHRWMKQSQRDDLESMGYMLLLFLRGSLPWHDIIQTNENVLQKKQSTSIEELCSGYPNEFKQYLTYCRGLGFEETPNYEKLRLSFSNLFRERNYKYDKVYDWIEREQVSEVD